VGVMPAGILPKTEKADARAEPPALPLQQACWGPAQ
jgi:hypothetical protein